MRLCRSLFSRWHFFAFRDLMTLNGHLLLVSRVLDWVSAPARAREVVFVAYVPSCFFQHRCLRGLCPDTSHCKQGAFVLSVSVAVWLLHCVRCVTGGSSLCLSFAQAWLFQPPSSSPCAPFQVVGFLRPCIYDGQSHICVGWALVLEVGDDSFNRCRCP